MKTINYFLVTLFILFQGVYTNAQITNCPNEIDGFTYLGEHNAHTYFLSTNELTWIEAQAICLQNNGYLAVINSVQENDFLNNANLPTSFIGFSDTEQEGTFEWINEDAFDFNNVVGNNTNGCECSIA